MGLAAVHVKIVCHEADCHGSIQDEEQDDEVGNVHLRLLKQRINKLYRYSREALD